MEILERKTQKKCFSMIYIYLYRFNLFGKGCPGGRTQTIIKKFFRYDV